jgi:hypothetical protein
MFTTVFIHHTDLPGSPLEEERRGRGIAKAEELKPTAKDVEGETRTEGGREGGRKG